MDDLCLFVSATVLLAVGFARYDKDKDHQYKFTYTGMLVGHLFSFFVHCDILFDMLRQNVS